MDDAVVSLTNDVDERAFFYGSLVDEKQGIE
jgi:hypothetical protein